MEWFHDGTQLRLMATPPPRTVAQLTNRCARVTARAALCKRCGNYADRGGPVPPLTDGDHTDGGTTCGAHEPRRSLVRTPWTPNQLPGHYVPHRAPTPPPEDDAAATHSTAAAVVDWITSAAVVAAAYAYAPATPHYTATDYYPAAVAHSLAGRPTPTWPDPAPATVSPHQPQRSLRRTEPADVNRSGVSSTAGEQYFAATSPPPVRHLPSAYRRWL